MACLISLVLSLEPFSYLVLLSSVSKFPKFGIRLHISSFFGLFGPLRPHFEACLFNPEGKVYLFFLVRILRFCDYLFCAFLSDYVAFVSYSFLCLEV